MSFDGHHIWSTTAGDAHRVLPVIHTRLALHTHAHTCFRSQKSTMSDTAPTKTLLQGLLCVQSANLQFMVGSLEDELDVENIIDSIIDDDTLGDLLDDDVIFLRRLGIDLLAVASAMDPRGPRGPYNQYEKCHEFFNKALAWPDRDFRNEFRYVMTIDCPLDTELLPVSAAKHLIIW